MSQLLHCDVARKAGIFVCLCYNLDSGKPARRNPIKKRFPASDTFVCLLQAAFHLWQVNECPLWWSPGCEQVFASLPQFGSQHRAVAVHMTGLCLRSSPDPPCLLKDMALHPGDHSAAVSIGSSCAIGGLESILISMFFLHLILPLPQIRELTLNKVTADKG